MKPTKLGLCAASLAIALCGIPYSTAQTTPGASIPTVPTNLPNVKTFVAPPATFNPVAASAEALQQYGFPPRPDQAKAPEAYNAWAKAVSAQQTRLPSPQLEQTTIYNGPASSARTIDNKTAARAIPISDSGCAKSQTATKIARRIDSMTTNSTSTALRNPTLRKLWIAAVIFGTSVAASDFYNSTANRGAQDRHPFIGAL
jgi:hypothetical protein